jgi:hypothetical protein
VWGAVHPRVDFILVVAGGTRNKDLTDLSFIRLAPDRRFSQGIPFYFSYAKFITDG